jgi:hypothetical protein
MKIILPHFIYKFFYKDNELYCRWMIFQSYKFKFYPIMMSNSFKALYGKLKKNDSQD